MAAGALSMRRGEILCRHPGGEHHLRYVEWGPADSRDVALCVHGLTRNARDFDALAQNLGDCWRVICPDVAGRGESDWLDPQHYAYPQYIADMRSLMGTLRLGAVDWVGTSMGGLIGMALAAAPDRPIRRLVLNDVGPFLPKAALQRIADYVGQQPSFEDIAAFERHLRDRYHGFGPMSDAQWRHMAETGHRKLDDGRIAAAYDPAIAKAFTAAPIADIALWSIYDAIATPTLLLHGERSDLLTHDTVAEMRRRGPRAELASFADCGHAPSLRRPEQIGAIRNWLEAVP